MRTDFFDKSSLKEIHLIPYSHNDFSWCNTREWHMSRYVQSIIEILDLMKTNNNVTWLIDNVLHTLAPFLKYCPERLEEFKMRAAEGRISIANGGMGLARPSYIGDETFIRNMAEAKEFFQNKLGLKDIDVFFNADVSCGHSQLPQVLSLGGHKYYRCWRPAEALDYKKVPKQFIWKGLDGSEIIVSRGIYLGFIENAEYLNKDLKNQWEEVKEEFFRLELENNVRLLPTDILWLGYGCDDFSFLYNRLNKPVKILEFIEEWNRRENIKIMFSTPAEYFRRLSKKNIPVYEGVLDQCELSYNDPKKGNNSIWRLRSDLERLIVKAESVSAIASVMGFKYPEEKIKSLWNALFEIAGHAIEWSFEEDCNNLYNNAKAAESTAKSLIGEACECMADMLKVEPYDQYVVINTLNWSRKEAVKLHVTNPFGLMEFDICDNTGSKLDYQVADLYMRWNPYPGCDCNSVDVIVNVEVPAFGYAALKVVGSESSKNVETAVAASQTGDTDFERRIINNGCLEIVLEDGLIKNIKTLRNGKSINSDNSSGIINNLRFVQTKEENTGLLESWEEVRTFGFIPENWKLVENGPVRWIYRVAGRIGDSSAEQDIIIKKDESAVEFSVNIDCTGGEGYFISDFPSDENTEIYADIPFGVEKRDISTELYGKTDKEGVNFGNLYERGWRGQFYAKSWALFEKNGIPAAIVSKNCSIYYNHDNIKNSVSILLHRLIPLRNMVFGPFDKWVEHCQTNMEGKGKHNFRYSIYFAGNKNCFSDIARFSKQNAQPLEVVRKHNFYTEINAESSGAFIKTDRENVIVSAFYKTGENFILRMFETDGKETLLKIQFEFDFNGAALIDFSGNQTDNSRIKFNRENKTIIVNVRPWQIMNIQLSF